MVQIIQSILDNDLYKFTQQNAVFQLYPRARVEYEFINRGVTEWPEDFLYKLNDQIARMRTLKLRHNEFEFLKRECPYLAPTYLEWLRAYRFDYTGVLATMSNGKLYVKITGPWRNVILWEVPLMAIISELYFRGMNELSLIPCGRSDALNDGKAAFFKDKGIKFADFGTRRRFSFMNHDRVVSSMLKAGDSFVGTSNVFMAKKYGLKPIGTHAHEWFMFHAAKHGFRCANQVALDRWVDVYRGDLGIALTDTYTTDNFLSSFDKKNAKLFDGVRHDSGDSFLFADRIVEHYKSLGIDPLSKVIVFSDGLKVENVGAIADYCKGKIQCSFGIGTNLTNDVGAVPLNMVIKMMYADPDGRGKSTPTVKLSDVDGKNTGDPEMVELCKKTIGA